MKTFSQFLNEAVSAEGPPIVEEFMNLYLDEIAESGSYPSNFCTPKIIKFIQKNAGKHPDVLFDGKKKYQLFGASIVDDNLDTSKIKGNKYTLSNQEGCFVDLKDKKQHGNFTTNNGISYQVDAKSPIVAVDMPFICKKTLPWR